MKRVRTDSSAANRDGGAASNGLHVTENFYAEDGEDVMRASLESAVTAAIELFQSVDKQQLSLLGATTELTGPVVERLIERYVTENVHRYIFPRLGSLKRSYDLELEAKIRQMEFIDASQLGIAIHGGSKGKHDLTIQLVKDDTPVTGQIITLEGKPIPGVTVRVMQINAAPNVIQIATA